MGSVERAACRVREQVQFTGWAAGKQQQAAFSTKTGNINTPDLLPTSVTCHQVKNSNCCETVNGELINSRVQQKCCSDVKNKAFNESQMWLTVAF